ncbi:hypothetical protein EU527_07945 [Candidatus Thorarchaeota archaeon]|nr:MAG: hypothetical protein EU527_07945 [Candidatus Thorarchaeota archaeon]
MFKFMKSDPLKKAKKHVEKALIEIEDGFPQYASVEYEKAARLFLEQEEIDFAVKYFREASYSALETNNHFRTAEMKIAAAECLFMEGRYDEGAGFYSEASDHIHREKKYRDSNRALAIAIIGYLAARNFDTATNLMRKGEKRFSDAANKITSEYELAKECVTILCDGADVEKKSFEKKASSAKPKSTEQALLNFVITSVRLALDTDVTLDWAGPKRDEVLVKSPIELELQFKCPTPVRVVDYRVSLSNSVIISRPAEFNNPASTEDSWLIECRPVLSGDGVVGPYQVTLEGDKVLVHKHSNKIEFKIARAPPNIDMSLSPERVSCTLGDEAILEVELKNLGDGPAENINVKCELSDGLETSLGCDDKTINFLGSEEKMRFQFFVRAIGQGDELVTIRAVDGHSGQEIVKTTLVRVG